MRLLKIILYPFLKTIRLLLEADHYESKWYYGYRLLSVLTRAFYLSRRF